MADETAWAPIEADAGAAAGTPRPMRGPVATVAGAGGGEEPPEPGGPVGVHPMTVSDVLDGAFVMLKANARPIVLVSAVFIVPSQLLAAFLQRDALGGFGLFQLFNDPGAAQSLAARPGDRAAGLGLLVTLASQVLVVPALAGAVSFLAARSYLGQEVSVPAALRVAVRRWWSLIVAWVLVHAAEAFASVFVLLPGLLALAWFVPVAPIVAIEGMGAFRAMRRSMRLVAPRLFPVLGVALASGLLAGAVSVALGVVPQMAAYAIGLRRGWLLLAAGSTVTALVTTPYIVLVATLVYFDARVRQEGLDLELTADHLDRARTAAA